MGAWGGKSQWHNRLPLSVAGFVLGKGAPLAKEEGTMSAEDRNGKVSSDEECTTRERSFDELTKGLASAAVTRGGALRLLAGALLGGGLASVPGVGRLVGDSGEAQAQAGGSGCANGGQSCTAQKCCKGFTCLVDQTSGTEKFCCPGTQVCGQTCCPTGGVCVNRQCICNNGTTRCIDPNELFDIGACRNLQNDNNNCGKCFTACNVSAGEACCSGVCKNLLEDEQNCGACGNSCAADATCIAGVCCPNTRVCGNTCLATACDATKCQVCDPTQGKCVSTCSAQETCIAGVCCPNTRACGNTCLATACDATNCQVCDPIKGACVSTCTTQGQGCCNGVCTDLNTVTNCGACGTTCAAGQSCVNGVCEAVCTAPQTLCNGTCVNLTTDANNCGSCGTKCSSGQGCCNGVCTALNTTTNCGSCNNVCRAPRVCCGGECKLPTGATCNGNGNCCSNRCSKNGVCAA